MALLTLSLVACGDDSPAGSEGTSTEAELDVVLANVTRAGPAVIQDGNDIGAVGSATQSFGVDLYPAGGRRRRTAT